MIMMINYMNKTFIEIGGLSIQWYAVLIMLSILLASILGIKEGRKLGIAKDLILDGVLYCVPLAIIGARIYYVIFAKWENPSQYTTLGEILNIRSGGLAIHGGLIVAFIFIIIYCKKRKISLYRVFDIVAPSLFIGQLGGRLGNFINAEAYGSAVQSDFVMNIFNLFPNWFIDQLTFGGAFHHPTFLYEMLWNITGFCIILIIRNKTKITKSGDFIGFYLIWYGLGRALLVEPLRTDALMIGTSGLRANIINSLIFALVGVIFLIVKRMVNKDVKYYYQIVDEVKGNKIKTIIFDMDGTLINTTDLIKKSFYYVFQKNFPDIAISEDDLNGFVGPALYETFSKYTSDKNEIERLIQEYREYRSEIHDEFIYTYSYVRSTISLLKRRGYQLAIVSTNQESQIKRALQYGKIEQYFDIIISSEKTKKLKPDPEGIHMVLKHFNTATAYYIGDTKTDIIAGKRANVLTIGVGYSLNKEALLAENPDYMIANMKGLLRILNE